MLRQAQLLLDTLQPLLCLAIATWRSARSILTRKGKRNWHLPANLAPLNYPWTVLNRSEGLNPLYLVTFVTTKIAQGLIDWWPNCGGWFYWSLQTNNKTFWQEITKPLGYCSYLVSCYFFQFHQPSLSCAGLGKTSWAPDCTQKSQPDNKLTNLYHEAAANKKWNQRIRYWHWYYYYMNEM